MSFYRVLVPLDGSELAETALPEAADIVNRLGQVRLIAVIDNEVPKVAGVPIYPLMGMGMAYLKVSAQEQLVQHRLYLKRITDKLEAKGIRADFVVHYGNPSEVIVQAADEFNADVIVMASHGRSGFSRQVMGSVAESVLRATHRPVLVVPPRKKVA